MQNLTYIRQELAANWQKRTENDARNTTIAGYWADAGSMERIRRSLGTRAATSPTTPSEATPPRTTAGTVPRRRAATPDSKAPISFDEPMKIEFTDDTRPS